MPQEKDEKQAHPPQEVLAAVRAIGQEQEEQDQHVRNGHVDAHQGANPEQDVQPGCKAGLAQTFQGKPQGSTQDQDEDADFHSLKHPVVQRGIKCGQGHREQGYQRASRQPFGNLADVKEGCDKEKHTADLDEQAGLRGRDGKEVEKRHEPHPQRVCVPFHRFSAGVPYWPRPRSQVLGVAHGNHGIVKKNKIALTLDNEAGLKNINRGVDNKSSHD